MCNNLKVKDYLKKLVYIIRYKLSIPNLETVIKSLYFYWKITDKFNNWKSLKEEESTNSILSGSMAKQARFGAIPERKDIFDQEEEEELNASNLNIQDSSTNPVVVENSFGGPDFNAQTEGNNP